MFKPLLINKDYLIDLKGNVIYKNEPLTYKPTKLDIFIDSVKYTLDINWLALICHYRVNLPIKEMLKINFVKCESRVIKIKCGQLMVFREPIQVDHGFYVIPGFTSFAITKEGVVKSIRYGKILNHNIGPYGYPYVNVFDPDKSKWRSVSLHILLARTFIPNPDPELKYFVNHRDGDKLNFNLKNLEWVTGSENQKHAFRSGLRKDNIPCRVTDLETGKIKLYHSLTEAMTDIGYKKNYVGLSKCENGLKRTLLGRYEVSPQNDSLEVNSKIFSPPRKIKIESTKNGEIIFFESIRQACFYLKVDKRTLKSRLKNGKNLDSWKIEEVAHSLCPTSQQ